MVILHVCKSSMPTNYGGIESFIDTLCKADSKLGVKNIVLTYNEAPLKQPIEMNGYTVYQTKQIFFIASTGFSLSAFGKFKELAIKSDIIHYHFPNHLPISCILFVHRINLLLLHTTQTS